jgi:cell division protein ZapE
MAPSVVACLERDIAAGRIEPDPVQRAAAARLDGLAASLAAPRVGLLQALRGTVRAAAPPTGLWLWGGVGRGKTRLLDLFHASLDGVPAERTHFYRFMRDVHAALREARHRSDPLQRVAAAFAARARVLCLDEFFVTDIADAMILGGLLSGLFAAGVTLVTTSNQAPDGLYPGGLQRTRFLPAIELIKSHVEVLHIDGPTDYRLRRLASAHTWLDAALPDSDARLRALFDSLTQGGGTGPGQVIIAGRPVAVLDAGAAAAWFDFDALCGTARSADDYIELARRYPTVFVAHIPLLAAPDDDAARRLVMLVDEFYDRGVKLVASAAAAPAALYGGERLRSDFERTASRLTEMQSQQYLAREHRA